mgnify:CR=1 FL=1
MDKLAAQSLWQRQRIYELERRGPPISGANQVSRVLSRTQIGENEPLFSTSPGENASARAGAAASRACNGGVTLSTRPEEETDAQDRQISEFFENGARQSRHAQHSSGVQMMAPQITCSVTRSDCTRDADTSAQRESKLADNKAKTTPHTNAATQYEVSSSLNVGASDLMCEFMRSMREAAAERGRLWTRNQELSERLHALELNFLKMVTDTMEVGEII